MNIAISYSEYSFDLLLVSLLWALLTDVTTVNGVDLCKK